MTTVRQFSLSADGNYKLVRTCEDRGKFKQQQPRDISSSLDSYLPFDDRNTQTIELKNLLSMRLPNLVLRSGQIYEGYDGKRLIYEVGCKEIIYLLINPKGQKTTDSLSSEWMIS